MSAQQIQDNARKSVLKIIVILSALSILAVLFVFLVSGASDSSLSDLRSVNNQEAEYQIPNGWSEESLETVQAYYNAPTLNESQATLLVLEPIKFSDQLPRAGDDEIDLIAVEYRRQINSGDSGITLDDGIELEIDGFYKVYEYKVEGVADDGLTPIRGVSRLLFDNDNYLHTIEFVATKNYWDANQSEIVELVDSYMKKASE